MNPVLPVFVLLISFSVFLVFADSNDDVDLLFNKGLDSYSFGDYEKAISYFDKVLEIDPNNFDALISKGRSLSQLNRDKMAISYFDKVLEIDPNNIDALISKGLSSSELYGNLEGMKYYVKVLEIDPDYDLTKHIPNEIVFSLWARVDGYAEIMVYDSRDQLVTYLINQELQVLNIKPAYDMINDWPVTKTVNRNGQDFKVHQNLHTMTSEVPKIVSRNQIKADLGDYTPEEGIISTLGDEVVVFRHKHPQFLLEPGDTVYTVFTFFEPVK